MDNTNERYTIVYETAEELVSDAIDKFGIHEVIESEWTYWFNRYEDARIALWNAGVLYLEKFLKSSHFRNDAGEYHAVEYDFELNGPEVAGAIHNILADRVMARPSYSLLG